MDISEAIKKRDALEASLNAQLKVFMEETGLVISEVSIRIVPVQIVGRKTDIHNVYTNVDIKLRG